MKVRQIKQSKRNNKASASTTVLGAVAGLAAFDTVQAKGVDSPTSGTDLAPDFNQPTGLQAAASDNIDQLVESYLTDTPVDQLHAEALSGAEIGELFPESDLLESLMTRGEQFAQLEGAGAGAGAGGGGGLVGAGAGVGAGLGTGALIGGAIGGAIVVAEVTGC